MNKKFVGALLLGSLIMAGGTFTGCSDYDDDINSVNERVDEVKSTLESLQTKVNEGATITSVEPTENGVKVTLSDGNSFELTNGKDGADGADGTPGTAWTIGEDGYWYKDGNKTDYKAIGEDGEKGDKGDKGDQGEQGPQGPQGEPGTPGTGVAGGIYYYPGTEGQFEGFWVKVEIDAEGNKTETNSGVAWTNSVAGGVSVVWDIYSETLTVDGVEGGETVVINLSRILKALVFAPDLYLDGVEATKYEYLSGNYGTWETQTAGGDYFDELQGEVVRYSIPTKNRLNTADAYTIGSKDEVVYHMNPSSAAEDDYNYRFLYDNPEYISTRANGAGVTVNYLDKVKENGDLKVTYQIESPELLAGKGGEHTESSNISVMALEAQTKNASEEKTITSDYAAIVPVVESLQAIAFIDYTTNENPACPKDLYNTGEEAVKNIATLDWEYNGGGLDLSKLLQVHYLSQNWTLPTTGTHLSMAYDDVKKYGLKWNYQMLTYTLGTNQTSESMYGTVDANGVFTPCTVVGENDGAGDATGNGNITSQPIPEGSTAGVSAIGRRPIVIVTLENETTGDIVLAGYIKINITREMNEMGVVVDSWDAPYVCDGFSNTFSWADMSDEVIETLGMSISDFRDAYTMVAGETYIRNASNEMQLVSGNIYGSMIEHKDAQVPTTNDVVEWVGGITELDNILAAATNREFTLYTKFISNKDGGINYVYVGMTIKVVEAPEVRFVERIDRYWYPESLAKEDRDTVRMNVPRPTNPGIPSRDIDNYYKDLNEYYVGNHVQIELTDAPQNVWYNLTSLGTKYYFRFAATQDNLVGPAGETYILSTNPSGSILYANGDVIAEIDPTTGVLDYNDNATAKEVLNLWGHAYPNTYAKVTLVATYDDCDLPLGDETFNVRFLRPLDILPGNDANFIDAQANGSTVILGDLFGLSDWRDQVLIVGTSGSYTSNVENGCPLYDYYHIESMNVLLDEVTCNLNGSWSLLSQVAPAVELSVYDSRYGNRYISGVATVDISGVSELNTSSITYRNNEANVRDFDMIIPVEIVYAWGTLKGEIKAHVDATMANK